MVKVAAKSKPSNKAKPSATQNSVSTENQQIDVYPGRGPRNRDHLAKPGQCLNPAGRPKGSRNKLSEAFVAELLQDWEQNGSAAIQRVRLDDPSTYLRVIAGLVPKEFSLKDDREQSLEKFLEQFTDEQLEEFERAVAAITAIPVTQSQPARKIAPKLRK